MFRSRAFGITATILLSVLTVEPILGQLNLDYKPRIVVFVSVTIISLILQYIILYFTISLFNHKKIGRLISISIIAIQSILAGLVIFMLLHVRLFDSSYQEYENLLGLVVNLSYTTGTVFLATIAYRFFKFYKTRTNVVILLYGLAFSALLINATLNCISIDIKFQDYPSIVGSERYYKSKMLVTITSIISISLLWAASIFLIHSNIDTLGKKYWVFAILPLVIIFPFFSRFLYFFSIDAGMILVVTILNTLARFIPAFSFAANFWILRKIDITNTKKIPFMVTGFGVFLYLLSLNQSPYIYLGDVIFPPSQILPYGIVTISLVGLFAYMINILPINHLPLYNKPRK